jgi:alkanesulfonate monooxygenase SsuD/methylene tetrahydromethanopterin reductase-like flavin-dependent oxidoreductase (luciferase family)
VVTADHASGGRVELGMGTGWFDGEHSAFGFPFPPVAERFDMLEEQVEIVHRLWDRDEEEVNFEGKYYRLQGCHSLPKPVQDPHPPLIIGGHSGPRSLRLTALWADEYNVVYYTPEDCRGTRGKVSAACEAAGRDPGEVRLSLMTNLLIGADRGEVEGRAKRQLERRGDTSDPGTWLDGLGPDRIWGTPERVLERLAEFAEAGVERVMFQHLLHDDLEAVALIGKEVIPQAADL